MLLQKSFIIYCYGYTLKNGYISYDIYPFLKILYKTCEDDKIIFKSYKNMNNSWLQYKIYIILWISNSDC